MMTKTQSRSATRYAIRTGRLQRQPCEVCADPLVDAHHTDYQQPLLVRWLCREHHFETHGWTWWTPEKIAATRRAFEEASRRVWPVDDADAQRLIAVLLNAESEAATRMREAAGGTAA